MDDAKFSPLPYCTMKQNGQQMWWATGNPFTKYRTVASHNVYLGLVLKYLTECKLSFDNLDKSVTVENSNAISQTIPIFSKVWIQSYNFLGSAAVHRSVSSRCKIIKRIIKYLS